MEPRFRPWQISHRVSDLGVKSEQFQNLRPVSVVWDMLTKPYVTGMLQ